MFYKLHQRIGRFIHPFKSIADSLAVIAECYELELAARTPPIRRVTEAPSRTDTKVMYTGVEEKEDPFEDTEGWEGGV